MFNFLLFKFFSCSNIFLCTESILNNEKYKSLYCVTFSFLHIQNGKFPLSVANGLGFYILKKNKMHQSLV